MKNKDLRRLTVDLDRKLHLAGSMLLQTKGMSFSGFAKEVLEDAIQNILDASHKKEVILSLIED